MSKYLLAILAGPNAVPIKPHLGDDVDVAALYWHPSARLDVTPDIALHGDSADCKFAAFHALFEDTPRRLEKYRAIALADDDLVPQGCTWQSIFDSFISTGFEVAQPALTSDSYVSHNITRQVSIAKYRRTSFVEVMCPIFRPGVLLQQFPLWERISEGAAWGLESYWGNCCMCGILDETPVRHVRPLRKRAYAQEMLAEKTAFESTYNLHAGPHMTWHVTLRKPS